MRRRFAPMVALVFAAVLAVGGCSATGGDEGSSATTSPGSPSTTAGTSASGGSSTTSGGSSTTSPSTSTKGSGSVTTLADLRTAMRPKGIRCDSPMIPPEDIFPPPDIHLDQRMDCHAEDIAMTFWSGDPGEVDEAIAYIRRTQSCGPATTDATIVDGGWWFAYSQSDHSPDGIGTPEERRTMRSLHQSAVDLAGGEVELLVPGCT